MQVEHIRNGMPAASLGPDGWRKPWSDNGGDCLEAKKLPGGRVASRQSTDPDSPALVLEPNHVRVLRRLAAPAARGPELDQAHTAPSAARQLDIKGCLVDEVTTTVQQDTGWYTGDRRSPRRQGHITPSVCTANHRSSLIAAEPDVWSPRWSMTKAAECRWRPVRCRHG